MSKIILPLLRNTMPNILANQILGVQPMIAPTASIFSLRTKYGLIQDMNWLCETEYTFKDSARFKPHLHALFTTYDQGATTERVNISWNSVAGKHIRRYLEENFGDPAPSNNYRWNILTYDNILISFAKKTDSVAFLLWYKGKTIQDLKDYFED